MCLLFISPYCMLVIDFGPLNRRSIMNQIIAKFCSSFDLQTLTLKKPGVLTPPPRNWAAERRKIM